MNYVYYAEISHDDYEQAFIGVFSTNERAQAACNDDALMTGNLTWEARGDSIRGTDIETGNEYIIMVIEIDYDVKNGRAVSA